MSAGRPRVLLATGNVHKVDEVQGTAEGQAFSRSELDAMLALAEKGIAEILDMQVALLATPPEPRAVTGRQ